MDQVFLEQIKRDEGLRLKMYKDSVGVPTIGYGHNLNKPISKRAAEIILEDDIVEHQTEMEQKLPWVKNLDPVRYRVILNMAFNLGLTELMKFKRTLAAIEEGKYDDAAVFMLQSLWAEQVGDRALRLAYMMQFGKDV